MERTQVWLRLVCFGFGMVVGILLPDKAGRRFFPHPDAPGAQLVRLMLGVTKTVVGCAVAVVAAPLPVAVSILYTGLGVYAAQTAMQPRPERQTLPIICTWLILFLPFTGALACLGGRAACAGGRCAGPGGDGHTGSGSAHGTFAVRSGRLLCAAGGGGLALCPADDAATDEIRREPSSGLRGTIPSYHAASGIAKQDNCRLQKNKITIYKRK